MGVKRLCLINITWSKCNFPLISLFKCPFAHASMKPAVERCNSFYIWNLTDKKKYRYVYIITDMDTVTNSKCWQLFLILIQLFLNFQ